MGVLQPPTPTKTITTLQQQTSAEKNEDKKIPSILRAILLGLWHDKEGIISCFWTSGNNIFAYYFYQNTTHNENINVITLEYLNPHQRITICTG